MYLIAAFGTLRKYQNPQMFDLQTDPLLVFRAATSTVPCVFEPLLWWHVGFLVAVAFLEKRRRRLVLVLSAMADLLGFLRAVGRYGRPTWLFESSGPLLEGYGKPFGLWRYERWAVSKLPSQDSPCSRHQVCSPRHHLKLQGICKSHGTSISHVLRVLPFRVVKPPAKKNIYKN
jgi:hypothetical protein